MKACKFVIIGLIALCCTTTFAQQSSSVSLAHFESLTDISWSDNGVSVDGPGRSTGNIQMSFQALGRSFDLQLSPNTSFLSNRARAAMPVGVSVYRGAMSGTPGSWARITVIDGTPRGLVFDGSELIAIEAPGAGAISSDNIIIYRLSDTYVAPGTMSCGSSSGSTNGSDMFKAMVGELSGAIQKGPGAISEITVSTIGDFEFATTMGGAGAAAIIARMNIVDGIYSEQLSVQIAVQTPEIFTDANDPFTDTTVADELLDELADYRFDTIAHYSHGLTHLFTTRVLDTPTVGIAYGGALCSRFAGAGLTQSDNGDTFDALIVAHEMGHNFGAPHDGQMGSACEAETEPFIMAPQINGSDQFSSCSIAQMQDDIAAASCINRLPSIDMTASLRAQPVVALLGNRVVFEFDIINRGTLSATNVVADITLPDNIAIQSTATTAGSCTDGAGSVNCVLGDVGGLASAVVTITANATTVGSDEIDIVLSADADDVPGNNQETVVVMVDPAVNLVLATPTAAQVTIDQSRSISTTVENTSTLAASGVQMSVTLDDGLRADSATWSMGSCSISAQQIDCQASAFGAQSSANVEFTVTGVTVGAQNYALSITSSEADAYTPDNSVNGTVNVNDENGNGGGEDDGGGGAFDWLLISLLIGWRVPWARRSVSHIE